MSSKLNVVPLKAAITLKTPHTPNRNRRLTRFTEVAGRQIVIRARKRKKVGREDYPRGLGRSRHSDSRDFRRMDWNADVKCNENRP